MELPKARTYDLRELLDVKLEVCTNICVPRYFYDIRFAMDGKFNFNGRKFLL